MTTQGSDVRTWILLFLLPWEFSIAACSSPPPDAQLITRFQQQRMTFEQIRSRACRFGHYQTIEFGFVDPALSDAEAHWFQVRLKRIGVKELNVHGTGPQCWLDLNVWSSGFAGTPARYKDFHFGQLDRGNATMATKVLSDLDDPRLSDQNQTLVRSIGSNWWLEDVWFP